MIDTKEERKRWQDEAAKRMDGFAYTQLSSGAAEVWRCQKPGEIWYAFDIAITRFGIAAFGDFGNLVFNVGAPYGMKFLAGKDVDYYIHSKLDEDCKRKTFDSDAFDQRRCEAVCERIGRINEEAALDDGDEGYLSAPDRGEESWEDYVITLRHFCISKAAEIGGDDSELNDLFYGMYEFLDAGADGARDAHDLFQENEELLGISDTWEIDFEKPCPNLLGRLYMLNHAARQIMKIKHPQPGSAVGEFGSMGESA